jgi:LysM repeat protein
MPSPESRSPARLLAPLALALCALAFFAVLATSGTDENGEKSAGGGETQTRERTSQTTAAKKPRPKATGTYTVKTGDTLGEIAQKTGVEVGTLQELNPDLDPQALVSGQKIKLRE